MLRFHSGKLVYESKAAIPFLQHMCERLGLGVWEEVTAEGAVRWLWYNKYV